MHKTNYPYIVATLLTGLILPSGVFAQSTNVKTPNTNQSAKLKSIVVKGSGNLIQSNSTASFIGGGQSNQIRTGVTNGVIGGGFGNRVTNHFGVVAGGINNETRGVSAVVSGGTNNFAGGGNSTVAGGQGNSIDSTGVNATIGGGNANIASLDSGTIGGGERNEVSNIYATVPGGYGNVASGSYSFAAGNTAYATNDSSFVWNGDPSGEITGSFGDYTFTVRCPGGARFYTAFGSTTNTGPRLAAGGTDWVSNSDSNLKTQVTAVDPKEILAKLSRLPVTEWEYKHNPHRRYIGPMAQDFHAIFGLGDDDKGIGTLDSDGVMYAAIQGLAEELKERDREIAQLKIQNEDLWRNIKAIQDRLNAPPATVNP